MTDSFPHMQVSNSAHTHNRSAMVCQVVVIHTPCIGRLPFVQQLSPLNRHAKRWGSKHMLIVLCMPPCPSTDLLNRYLSLLNLFGFSPSDGNRILPSNNNQQLFSLFLSFSSVDLPGPGYLGVLTPEGKGGTRSICWTSIDGGCNRCCRHCRCCCVAQNPRLRVFRLG